MQENSTLPSAASKEFFRTIQKGFAIETGEVVLICTYWLYFSRDNQWTILVKRGLPARRALLQAQSFHTCLHIPLIIEIWWINKLDYRMDFPECDMALPWPISIWRRSLFYSAWCSLIVHLRILRFVKWNFPCILKQVQVDEGSAQRRIERWSSVNRN